MAVDQLSGVTTRLTASRPRTPSRPPRPLILPGHRKQHGAPEFSRSWTDLGAAFQYNRTALFPDGPAEFLHAPHLKAMAKRSVRFANSLPIRQVRSARRHGPPSCPASCRAAPASGPTPPDSLPISRPSRIICAPAGYHTTLLSGKVHFVGPRPAATSADGCSDRYLSRRFRLDARLYQARRAHLTGGTTISAR